MESSAAPLGGDPIIWIVVSGLAMSLIALVGSVTLVLREATLQKILLPLVAFAAGALIGGALFHMLPVALSKMESSLTVFLWTAAGFTTFFLLEQALNWHQCHRRPSDRKAPLTYLVLVADGLHNLIGGLSVGAIFLIDVRLGVTAWLAAAAHEIPQELGDFGVLVHGGFRRRSALLFNFISGLTFLMGGVLAWGASFQFDLTFLVPFAAGNFLYIGAVDLVPEVKTGGATLRDFVQSGAFVLGLVLLWALRFVLGGET